MSDITMCSSINCPMRATCYRSKAKASNYQSWYNFEYTCNEVSEFPDYIKMGMKVSRNVYKQMRG